jgi:hypothetical protein
VTRQASNIGPSRQENAIRIRRGKRRRVSIRASVGGESLFEWARNTLCVWGRLNLRAVTGRPRPKEKAN